MTAPEAAETFPCFGGTCAVLVMGEGAAEAVAHARRRLLDWHRRFTRFDPSSELSRLNADPRAELPVSRTMAELVEAIAAAGAWTGGLVDGTLLREIEAAGYRRDAGDAPPPARAIRPPGARRPARASGVAGWRRLALDPQRRILRRPPGVAIDGGGLAKGLFADLLAADLAEHDAFAVDCAGDLRLGGAGGLPRPVHVAGPFGDEILQTFELTAGGVATSGITRRHWLDARGLLAQHLLDPATGRPAYTGVVQATALAPTALEAEVRAKAAVLSGPEAALSWLPHGGLVVLEDGSHSSVNAQAPPRGASASAPRVAVPQSTHGGTAPCPCPTRSARAS